MTMKKGSQKLAIEDYLDFIDNRAPCLAPAQLRQIIGIHGFKKMKFQKNLSIEMISTMDLMDLRRSTLLDGGTSSDASLTLEELIKDLKGLDWQECQVTSLLTQGVVAPPPATYNGSGAVSLKRKTSCETASVKRKADGKTVAVNREIGGGTVSVKRKSGGGTVSVKRRKLKSLKAVGNKAIEVGVDDSVVSAGTPVATGGTTENLRSLACNSVTAVASPPIISLLLAANSGAC